MPLLEENGPCYRKASHERCSCGSFDSAQDDTGWDGFLLSHPDFVRMGHPFFVLLHEQESRSFAALRMTNSCVDDNSGSGVAKNKGLCFCTALCSLLTFTAYWGPRLPPPPGPRPPGPPGPRPRPRPRRRRAPPGPPEPEPPPLGRRSPPPPAWAGAPSARLKLGSSPPSSLPPSASSKSSPPSMVMVLAFEDGWRSS